MCLSPCTSKRHGGEEKKRQEDRAQKLFDFQLIHGTNRLNRDAAVPPFKKLKEASMSNTLTLDAFITVRVRF